MRDQRVEIAIYDRDEVPFLQKDEWQFAAKHRWHWFRRLQVMAFEWLVKHGALVNVIGKKVAYRQAALSSRNPTMQSIHEVAMHLVELNERPHHLYVGRDVAGEIMGLANSAQVMHFTSGPAREIMGIPWTIVPWMEGWVIVPEERR